jgi:hypothetical protein
MRHSNNFLNVAAKLHKILRFPSARDEKSFFTEERYGKNNEYKTFA